MNPLPCERCGQPHARCSGHTRAGKPCGQPPMAGQRVCRMHGGKSPQALAKAEERQVEAAAEEEISKLWPGLADAAAVKDPIDLLARTGGALEQMAEVIGKRVNELEGKLGAGKARSQLRAEVVLLDRVLDKIVKVGEVLARLDIKSRSVELEQARAEIVLRSLASGMEALASAGVGELSVEQRRAFEAGFIGELRRQTAVVQGEVVA